MDPWIAPEPIGYDAMLVSPLAPEATSSTDTPADEQSMLRLVSLGLERNPATRASWQRAQAAAAQYGRTRSEWYPVLGLNADFYYGEALYPGPGFPLQANEWTIIPSLALDYILLDFGRREADDDRARQTLWAANLQFNRQVQQTIYDVQRTYFRHDEAIGLHEAAMQNLILAQTVVEAVEDRLLMGLSTMPELLLARQELARARFDVEATVADVYTSKADILEVLGYPATVPLEIVRLDDVPVPEALAYRVRDVIDTALRIVPTWPRPLPQSGRGKPPSVEPRPSSTRRST